MLSLKELRSKIDLGIEKIQFERQPIELYEPINYILGLGGKRLRPALCLLACDMVGGNVENALNPAIGIEIFHNFTLLHDDIMDNAPIRRGKETVHKKWDQNAAILSGDTMMALAYEFIMKAPEKVRSEVFSIFNNTAIEVCEGQQYDMNFETIEHVSIDDYLKMIRLKTAVLLAGSLKIGAVIGEAPPDVASELYRFGEHIGTAFQLQDDLLDVFSDVDKFGKTTGGDILSNKKTFLYLKAFELASGENRSNLKELFCNNTFPANEKISRVKEIYHQLDVKNATVEKIDAYYKIAMDALDNLSNDLYIKEELIQLANLLKQRDN